MAILAAGLLVVAAGMAAAFGPLRGAGDDAAANAGQASGPGWESLPDPPLDPRSFVVGVWTGDVFLFVAGSTFLCPPNADCAQNGTSLADGAIFDPALGTWRSTTPAPLPFASASTAVLGDDVYFLARGDEPRFLRYSVAADSWVELPLPPGNLAWYHLVAAGDSLVAYAGSHERAPYPDLLFDPASRTWRELPLSPLGLGFARQMTWLGPHLYLFDHELVPNPGSERPALTRAARFSLADGEWERLPDSEILGTGPWLVEGSRLVNPMLGEADGGKVNNWGRAYPQGGILASATGEWLDLPPPPASDFSVGAVGTDGAMVHGMRGWVLDVTTGTWLEVPPLPAVGDFTRRNLVAGDDLVIAFGGESWGQRVGTGELLGDAWSWRFPGRP